MEPQCLYPPLNQDTVTIRLFQLLPSPAEKIQGRLLSVSMDQAQNLHYTAILYVTDECEAGFPISVNGHTLNVDRTLIKLLAGSSSRPISTSQYFWTYRICVDQSNAAERAEQVRQIGQIYSRAASVAVLVETASTCVDSCKVDIPMEPIQGCIHQAMRSQSIDYPEFDHQAIKSQPMEYPEFDHRAVKSQAVDHQDFDHQTVNSEAIDERDFDHQAMDHYNWPENCNLRVQAPYLHPKRNITHLLGGRDLRKLHFGHISVREWRARDEIRNANSSHDTGRYLCLKQVDAHRFRHQAAETFRQEYWKFHEDQRLFGKPSTTNFPLAAISLAASIGNIPELQLEFRPGTDTIGHLSHIKDSENTFEKIDQGRPFQENRETDMRQNGWRGQQNRDVAQWIQSEIEILLHRYVRELGRTHGFITIDNAPTSEENLMEYMTPWAVTVAHIAHEIIDMLLKLQTVCNTREPQRGGRTGDVSEFGIAAELLTRWMKCFSPVYGSPSDVVFPLYALEDWEVLHATMISTSNESLSDHSALGRSLGDAFGWWQLQVRSAIHLFGSRTGEADPAGRLDPSFGSGIEDDKATAQWLRLYNIIFPSGNLERHFAVRSACCVASSFRPLDSNELFSLATAKVLPDDPEWPWHDTDQGPDGTGNVERLMSSCGLFLWVDLKGLVRFKSCQLANLLSRRLVEFAKDAHHFMAFACLRQIEVMGSQLLLEPWDEFQFLQGRFPSHDYVVTFWQYHYRIAEEYSEQLPGRLQILLSDACFAAKQASLFPHLRASAGNEVDESALDRMSRAVHLAYEFCKKHNFAKLENAYELMGARARTWGCSLCQNCPTTQPRKQH